VIVKLSVSEDEKEAREREQHNILQRI